MAILKTYEIAVDITSQKVAPMILHRDIELSGYISGFECVDISSTHVDVHGTSLLNESSLDTLLQDHLGIPSPGKWTMPSNSAFYNWAGGGMSLKVPTNGAGLYGEFDQNVNERLYGMFELDNKSTGIPYDGSDIKVPFRWQFDSTNKTNKNVKWKVKWCFWDDGDNPITKASSEFVKTITLTSLTANSSMREIIHTIPGVVGKHMISITIERFGTSDTFQGKTQQMHATLEEA